MSRENRGRLLGLLLAALVLSTPAARAAPLTVAAATLALRRRRNHR